MPHNGLQQQKLTMTHWPDARISFTKATRNAQTASARALNRRIPPARETAELQREQLPSDGATGSIGARERERASALYLTYERSSSSSRGADWRERPGTVKLVKVSGYDGLVYIAGL